MRRKCPNILEFTSYIFCFHGLMCGPFCFYKDYLAYIRGTNYPSAVTRTTAKTPSFPVASRVVVQEKNATETNGIDTTKGVITEINGINPTKGVITEINGIDPTKGVITENLTTRDYNNLNNHNHNHVNGWKAIT